MTRPVCHNLSYVSLEGFGQILRVFLSCLPLLRKSGKLFDKFGYLGLKIRQVWPNEIVVICGELKFPSLASRLPHTVPVPCPADLW